METLRLPTGSRRNLAVAIAAVILAIVGATLAWQSGRPAPSDRSAADPSTGPSLVPVGSAVPGAAWTPTAELVATAGNGSFVDLASGFRMTSLDGTPAAELAERLTIEPALELAIEPEPDGGAVRLTPVEPLVPGAVYRFTLAGEAGQELDSWAFQVDRPVRVVGTLPSDEATDVPLDTGIEVTFDQDGVADAESHVAIEPAADGRFEQHGRTLVFVPERLEPATVYHVTVGKGVTAGTTGEPMVDDYRFAFETVGADGATAADVEVGFHRQLVESSTAAAPALGAWAYREDDSTVASIHVDVYRLPGLDAAIDAYRQLRSAPTWSRWSTEGVVATADLPKVASFDARLRDYRGDQAIAFPEPLDAGWYVVEHPDGRRPPQAIVQVTDLSGYLSVSDTRTVVWANDLATTRPVANATVAIDDGTLGTTDSHGLLVADTPDALLGTPDGTACEAGCQSFVTVRDDAGRAAFLPVGNEDKFEFLGGFGAFGGTADHWSLLNTDRTRYRPTDTINVWGVLRDRDSGVVPATVRAELHTPSSDGRRRPPVAVLELEPGATGVFTGSIAVRDLPPGAYTLELRLADELVRSTWLEVGPILKPAYRLEVETGRRVYVRGDRIRVTARATFYDGTPVPGVPLRLDGQVEDELTTDATGTVTRRSTIVIEEDFESPESWVVNASPARAEEGAISGASREYLVFPSRRTIDATAQVRNGRVRVSGEVHTLDVDRIEREIVDGTPVWEVDPNGPAVRGATVTARFFELIPVRTRIGTEYDFISKKTVPTYTMDIREREAGTRTVRTDADGGYALAVSDSGEGNDYRVVVTVRDPDGLRARSTTWASAAGEAVDEGFAPGPRLLPANAPASGFIEYSVGDRIDLRMRDDTSPPDVADATRYLFIAAQAGIRDAQVGDSARYLGTFDAAAVPNLDIVAVRFTGRGYVGTDWYRAELRRADRRLDVELSVDAPRYAPGDDVTVAVRTRDAAGRPVPASVVLQAVDEKLFTIGAAASANPLEQLYEPLGSGIRSSYSTHDLPRGASGADTGGGGNDRDTFRDVLLFRAIETGADGRGTASFSLSDDLTSWRVEASAISADLEAGGASIQVPVGLPFFVEAAVAPEYLAADRPTIQVRTFGSDLEAGAAVTVTVSSETLGLSSGPIESTAFESVDVALPALSLGRHSLTIAATTGSGSGERTDRLTRTFEVVESRLTASRIAYAELDVGWRPPEGQGMTTVVLSDAGSGRHLSSLVELAETAGGRLDQALVADIAARILAERFELTAGPAPGAFSSVPYQTNDGGLALLPYASSDLELSALVALVVPQAADPARLGTYLTTRTTADDETRERTIIALAGLAGLGEPVLGELQAAAADPDLTIRERLWVGLGAAALGDVATARAIVTRLAEASGESLGTQARLRAGSSSIDVTTATALMAALAAATGDPAAPAYWSYVADNPNPDDPLVLHRLAYVRWSLDRLPRRPAGVAYSVGGQRTVVELRDGEALRLDLIPAQLASLELEPLSGTVGVTTSWREPVAADAFEPDPDVTLTRAPAASGRIESGDLVTVDLEVTFGSGAAKGCHHVVELVPSGLVPVGELAAWLDESEEAPPPADVIGPYAQAGQRVAFCAEPGRDGRTATLRYHARVITPGSYRWEPAVLESRTGPARAALTEELTIRIR